MPIFRRGGSGGGGGSSSRPGGPKKRPMGGGPGGGKMSGGKSFGGKKKAAKKKFAPKRKKKIIKKKAPAPSIEITGMESLYLKELMDAEMPVVVVMSNGDRIQGVIRYYDRDVFSLGPADGSPKVFLRKSSIRYLYELEE